MARPIRCRRICFEPEYDSFAPCGIVSAEQIVLTVDEFEAVRLIDHENICSATALHGDAVVKNVTGQNMRLGLPQKERKTRL